MPTVDDSYRYWLNRIEYPFAMREFDSGDGWMNYVDEGHGRPVVFVHGCMTWSFLFRRTIEELSGSFRCIAPDHLGFGLSEKPEKGPYSPQDHVNRFGRLMDSLNLSDITLVVHDFGGPIGLKWAAANPDRVKELVILNTYAWSLAENPVARRLAVNYSNPLNRFYYRHLRATPTFVLPPMFADRYRMSKAILKQYLNPFPDHSDRLGLYSLVTDYVREAAWFDEIEPSLETLRDKRTLILWGMKDPMLTEEALVRMQKLFPEHQTIQYPESGRFFPEEQPHVLGGELQWFLMNTARPGMALIDQLGG